MLQTVLGISKLVQFCGTCMYLREVQHHHDAIIMIYAGDDTLPGIDLSLGK